MFIDISRPLIDGMTVNSVINVEKIKNSIDVGEGIACMRISGLQAGIVMAIIAVIVSALVGERAEDAYGICLACHGRDLLGWILNWSLDANIPVAPAFLVFPALTSIGIMLGSLLAAIISGEFRWHVPDSFVKPFLLGLMVMVFALVAGGCATRLLLRTSAMEFLGLAGFAAMAVGVVAASYFLRWWAQR